MSPSCANIHTPRRAKACSCDVCADRRRRAKVIYYSALALLFCVPLYIVFFIAAGVADGLHTAVILGAGLAVLPVFPLARRETHLSKLGNYVLLILWIVLLVVGRSTGGLASATAYWLPALPVIALLLTGLRSALVWTAVVILQLGTLHWFGHLFPPPRQVLSPSWLAAFVAFGQGTLCLLLLAVGVVHEHALSVVIQRERRGRGQLATSEASFRALIERLPEAVLVHRSGSVVYANAAAIELLGHADADDLLGGAIEDLLHPEERAPQAGDALLLARDDSTASGEQRWLRSDGAVLDIEMTALVVVFDGERSTVVIGRDVTDRKQLTSRMMQMDRVLVVGTLAAGIAHEINNPLTFVGANIEFASEQLNANPIVDATPRAAGDAQPGCGEEAVAAAVAALADAAHGVTRIRTVIEDVETFARADEDSARVVDVDAVIDSTLNIIAKEIAQRARLVTVYGGAVTFANASRLGQVFLNLLVNALHAIDDGGPENNEITVRTAMNESGVLVEVKDTGCGIPADRRRRIFDPFYTTKPMGVGTGLGLSVCRRLLHSMGGTIEVDSEVAVGTTFRVSLPGTEETPSLAPAANPAFGCEHATHFSRALVVDDEPLVGRSIRRALRATHRVFVVHSGPDALELLGAGEQFDIILCDLMMPEMTGMQVYEEVCERWPRLAERMVFMTGGAFSPKAQAFLDARDENYLRKPFDLGELRRLAEHRRPEGLER